MLWTEQEAITKQVNLMSSEVSCGATAIINLMVSSYAEINNIFKDDFSIKFTIIFQLVLKMQLSIEKIKEGISTRLKSDTTSIPQFLISSSFNGAAYENLIKGIQHASNGSLYGKFFQLYPRRDIVLSEWLSHWMRKGAVPIATMNIQRNSSSDNIIINDTRHHQMIFGVNSKGIYLTNPLECVQEEELWNRITSPSVLYIRRQEIISRWSPETDLKPLMCQSDSRWKTMNVLGS